VPVTTNRQAITSLLFIGILLYKGCISVLRNSKLRCLLSIDVNSEKKDHRSTFLYKPALVMNRSEVGRNPSGHRYLISSFMRHLSAIELRETCCCSIPADLSLPMLCGRPSEPWPSAHTSASGMRSLGEVFPGSP
jgi:hypothetical protein